MTGVQTCALPISAPKPSREMVKLSTRSLDMAFFAGVSGCERWPRCPTFDMSGSASLARTGPAPAGTPEAPAASPLQTLLAVLCVGEPRCTMRLESLCCTWKFAFHIAFGALNIVSEDVESCPIALRLNSHCFSPFVESQGTACAVLARLERHAAGLCA